jgi:hypothetical protein
MGVEAVGASELLVYRFGKFRGLATRSCQSNDPTTPSSRNNARVPNTEPFVLARCLHLGFPYADHRNGVADGVETFQFKAGLLTGSARILLDNGGEISPAKSGFG